MKILTLNCHSWQEEKQIEKIKYLANIIKEKKYDVITLQEVSQKVDSEYIENSSILKEDNYAVVLLNELKSIGITDYKMVWDFSKIGYEIYEEGACILTKHNIVESESRYVSKNCDIKNWKSRKIIKASLDYKGEILDVYSAHLGWWDDEQEPFKYQADNLIKMISNEKKSIIAGDFNNNANISNEGYDYLVSKGFKDTYKFASTKDSGVTVKGNIDGWEENKIDLRLDIIFTNFDVKINSSNVIFNGLNKRIISDHFGVELELNI